MGKALILLVGVVVGLIGGVMFGGALIGSATGVGLATGMSAGICSVVQAAQEEGLLTADQVDQVITRAAANLSDISGTASAGDLTGMSADCENVLQQLRETQG